MRGGPEGAGSGEAAQEFLEIGNHPAQRARDHHKLRVQSCERVMVIFAVIIHAEEAKLGDHSGLVQHTAKNVVVLDAEMRQAHAVGDVITNRAVRQVEVGPAHN